MATPSTAPNLAALRALLPRATPTRAWRAIRELAIVAPTVSRPALELAAEFAEIASPPTERLLKFWPTTPDPDGFAEFLLAPAFVREGRTELQLKGSSLTPGLRHLSNLRKVDLRGHVFYEDIAELAGLTHLTQLELSSAALVTDFSPLAALTRLESLHLLNTRISDLTPLLGMRRLRWLDLSRTEVTRLDGFADAFPLLSHLDLSHCRSLSDVSPLSGLPQLQSLDLSYTKVSTLTGLRDLDALQELVVGSPDTPITSIDGIDALPSLKTLCLTQCTGSEMLNTGGPYHRLTNLRLPSAPLPDLSFVHRFPDLAEISIHDDHARPSLKGLAGHPSIAEVTLSGVTEPRDLSALAGLPALRTLHLVMLRVRDLGLLADLHRLDELDLYHLDRLSTLEGIPAVRSLTLWNCRELADLSALDDRLEKLDILGCGSLADPRRVARLGGLKELHLDLPLTSLADLHGLDALTELHLNSDQPTSHAGIEGLPALRTLSAEAALTGLEQAGHPHLAVLSLPRRPLPGLRFLSGFPSLAEISLLPEHELTCLDGLEEHPSIATVRLFGPLTVKDLSALTRLPALRTLTFGSMMDFDELLLPSALSRVESLRLRNITHLRTLNGFTHLPALRSLQVDNCPELRDLDGLIDLPALERVEIHDCPDLPEAVLDRISSRVLLTTDGFAR
ncbi:leucine-rich repeat domain-containing protein [Nonomuraea helvata]|uniref:Leucine-rich repeat domain-containing protein n=1 Tax=Nonomuraea helvata TaxID=37484 RepID=A0ABV5RYL7_9ACTN